MSRCLTSRRRRLLSSWRSAASCPLTPPLPFASCTPPLFASCLSAGCCVNPVVPPPPPPPRDFASTSSLPSGCLNSQRCLLSSSRLCLATRRLRLLTRRRLTTGCVVAIANAQMLLPSMRRRLCHHRDCDCRPRCLLSSWCRRHRRRCRRGRCSSPSSSSLYPVAPSPLSLTSSPVAPSQSRGRRNYSRGCLNQIPIDQGTHEEGVLLHNISPVKSGDRLSLASHTKTLGLEGEQPSHAVQTATLFGIDTLSV